MGSSASKLMDETKNELSSGENVATTPILTPQIRRLDLDPRSPSSDIARTPIEVLKTPATTANNSLNVTEDLSNCTEEQKDYTNIDPRSPTTEFHRTPIVIEDTTKYIPLRNKNLEKVLMPTVAVTPIKPKKNSERVIRKIYDPIKGNDVKVASPKLLESNPIVIKLPENKRNSVVGLLETNIDYVETDLDVVIQNKLSNSKIEPSLDDENISSISSESVKSSLESLEDINEEDEIKNNSYIETDENSENDVEVSATVDLPTDKEIIKDVISTPEESGKTPESNSKTVTSVEELNRKLTNLIYEDRQYEVSPKAQNPIVTHRTPLGDRNTNSQQRRSIPVLRVSDKPKKAVVVPSRIPVFKEKKGRGSINVQCENTPPRMQPKRSQWCAEDSLII